MSKNNGKDIIGIIPRAERIEQRINLQKSTPKAPLPGKRILTKEEYERKLNYTPLENKKARHEIRKKQKKKDIRIATKTKIAKINEALK